MVCRAKARDLGLGWKFTDSIQPELGPHDSCLTVLSYIYLHTLEPEAPKPGNPNVRLAIQSTHPVLSFLRKSGPQMTKLAKPPQPNPRTDPGIQIDSTAPSCPTTCPTWPSRVSRTSCHPYVRRLISTNDKQRWRTPLADAASEATASPAKDEGKRH